MPWIRFKFRNLLLNKKVLVITTIIVLAFFIIYLPALLLIHGSYLEQNSSGFVPVSFLDVWSKLTWSYHYGYTDTNPFFWIISRTYNNQLGTFSHNFWILIQTLLILIILNLIFLTINLGLWTIYLGRYLMKKEFFNKIKSKYMMPLTLATAFSLAVPLFAFTIGSTNGSNINHVKFDLHKIAGMNSGSINITNNNESKNNLTVNNEIIKSIKKHWDWSKINTRELSFSYYDQHNKPIKHLIKLPSKDNINVKITALKDAKTVNGQSYPILCQLIVNVGEIK